MKRLRRILLNATTALSLILFAATVALRVRSYRTADQIWGGGYLVASECGAVYLSGMTLYPDPGYPIRESFDAGKLGVMEQEWSDDVRRIRPIRLIYRVGPSPTPAWLVIVADWFAALAFAALPVYCLARRIKRRHKSGVCPTCGYGPPRHARAVPGVRRRHLRNVTRPVFPRRFEPESERLFRAIGDRRCHGKV
jgi:hypothetical protein